jgi:flagellar hook-associated protein 2
MESVSLIDAVYSARLTIAGLPALANVQESQTGITPSADPYAAPSSSLTQLSGYGQLLSAASRSADGFQQLLGSNSNLASSSNEAIVTATASSEATVGSYSITVNQAAQSQNLVSGYFTTHDAQVLSAGSFTLAVGSNTPVTITLTENADLITDVGYAWGSLDNLAAVINEAGAGVTASVENGAYGYQLKLVADATGAANTLTLNAESDPLNGGDENLALLAFTQSQQAVDASYSVDSGAVQTSASNENLSLASGVSFNIEGTGTTTVTVASTPFVATDLTSVTNAATQLVQQYNALIGTSAQLLASGGALDGDTTTATPLSQAMYTASLADYDSGNTAVNSLSELGITGTGVSTGALTLDSGALTTAFGTDATATASLLTKVANTLHSIISGYLGDSGAILGQAKTVETSMAFLDGQTASNYPNLANDIKQYVLQKSLASASVPTGLPSISVFA